MNSGLTPIAYTPSLQKQIEELDQILGPGYVQTRSVPTWALKPFKGEPIMLWCKIAGIHQIVTDELIDFLRVEVGDLKAIEVCAGRGILGECMSWPQTDMRLLERYPLVRSHYAMMQENTDPLPKQVITHEAVAAVKKYKPDAVVGCWVTQYEPNYSIYGVREFGILERVKKYVVVGNESTHGTKKILKMPHRKLHVGAPWLVSRSAYPEQNLIYVWDTGK